MGRSTLSSDVAWRFAEVIRTGFLDFRAATPWRVRASTLWPRVVLQCLFYVLLGKALSQDHGAAYAYVGSAALAISLPASISIASVPMTDRQLGTFYRLRLGRLPMVAVLALRAVPWLLEAMTVFVLSTVVIGTLTGQLTLAAQLLALTPVFLVMAVTNAVAGLAVTAFALRSSAEVLVGNALAYLIIGAGGIVVPADRLAWLAAAGRILPLRNGLLAVRAVLQDQPWAGHLAAEVLVGGGWMLLGVIGYSYHAATARRRGQDAFA